VFLFFFVLVPTQVPVAPYLLAEVPLSETDKAQIDVVQALPGQVVRLRLKFAPQAGGSFPFAATQGPQYLIHCHLIDHEDNEMMIKLFVRDPLCQNNQYSDCILGLGANQACCNPQELCKRHATNCNGTVAEGAKCIPQPFHSMNMHE
jgi:hypothetical protein